MFMKKLTLFTTLLFYAMSLQSMFTQPIRMIDWEPLSRITENKNVHPLNQKQHASVTYENPIRYTIAHTHNWQNAFLRTLVSFPVADAIHHILLYCQSQHDNQSKALENDIKTCMALSITCKHLHALFDAQRIGTICQWYHPECKDKVLHDIVKSMYAHNYQTKRLPLLIVIHAGAKNMCIKTSCCEDEILDNAVLHNDAEMIELLFEHGANPNAKYNLRPLFYYAGTVEIAEMFFKNGCKICTKCNKLCPNVLWNVIRKKYPSELMAFYIEHGVNAKKILDPLDEEIKGGNCLLHELANPVSLRIDDIEDFLQKGRLLLQSIPELINRLNNDGQTPLDLAQKSFEDAGTSMCKGTPEAFAALCTLYKNHGGCLSNKKFKTHSKPTHTVNQREL